MSDGDFHPWRRAVAGMTLDALLFGVGMLAGSRIELPRDKTLRRLEEGQQRIMDELRVLRSQTPPASR